MDRLTCNLSDIQPKTGEKSICPKASEATTKPYTVKVTRLSN